MTTNRPALEVRTPQLAERGAIVATITSDATFKATEVAVAVELIDAALAASPDYLLLVALRDEGIVGYICFGPTPMTDATWDLYWVVVGSAHRGLGAARTLVAAMEASVKARGGRHVRVETSETEGYGAARALYARLGYPEASVLPDFYSPGDALITYYKQL